MIEASIGAALGITITNNRITVMTAENCSFYPVSLGDFEAELTTI